MPFPPLRLPMVDEMKSFLSNLLEDQARFGKRYEYFTSQLVRAQFRVSIVKRRKTEQLDFDIIQIAVPPHFQKKGNATEFFKIVVYAAQELGRGVYVENCNTAASEAWRERLISLGLADGLGTKERGLHALSKDI